jgi:hypothetical protein
MEDNWSAVNRRNGNLVHMYFDKVTGKYILTVKGENIHPYSFVSRFKGEVYREYNLALA